MSDEVRRAARAEALTRVAATHRPLDAVIEDLRRETGTAPPEAPAAVAPTPPAVEAALPAPVQVPVASAESAQDRNLRTLRVALAEGRVPRQRFGDPYCPAPACYGRDYRVLDAAAVAADGVPPYADDCNCTVIVD